VTTQTVGRPQATSHAAIEAAAFALFEENGFDATTMDDIAAAVGVGRRTLFRYYPSKNDILWGQFDESLREFRRTFRQLPADTPLPEAIRDAIIKFNTFDSAALPQHRRRMSLLLGTPALLAHSELRYAAWRAVVAEYVADRLGERPEDLLPTLAGRIALAVAISAYERWLATDAGTLPTLIGQAAAGLGLLVG
jgi:mycofactocin system transcriptional regulator